MARLFGEAQMARTTAYFTTTDEDHDVYHNQDDCPTGSKILAKNRSSGDIGSRSLCAQCAKHGYGHYDTWLSEQEAQGEAACKKEAEALQKLTAQRDAARAREDAYGHLQTQFDEIANQRKALESNKNRTAEENEKLASLKVQYNELYQKLQSMAAQHTTDSNDLVRLEGGKTDESGKLDEGQIKRRRKALDRLESNKARYGEAAARLAAAHAAAVAGRSDPEKVELIADVVMNEARGEDPYIKKCLAYAYLNLTKGDLRPPRGAEISNFTRSEKRFNDPDEGDQVKYIRSVADSLEAVRARLDEPKSDPTHGANHWASPKSMSKKRRAEYESKSGEYEWLNRAVKIPMKDIPDETFTFWKTDD